MLKKILYLLIVCCVLCLILKRLNKKKNKKLVDSLGRTGGSCIKDDKGFTYCKEDYDSVNYKKFEKVGTKPLYHRPEPEDECFYSEEGKLVCRDGPFSPYNKYHQWYSDPKVRDFQYKSYPYKQAPYSMVKQFSNYWG